ncbi:DNA primase family protein [Prosthecochloris vibrioformis]|uniref:DNA primase n=1 Tax=Prosthecochloris vibrioformis TaxID=1098 RepID=A0A5C4S1P1_PROVB|nr:phage/plasmid primase, P4 family [Prosthecochloris vibrioformis]TNJ37406.1 DNA primase [Prosthecochloris vibrioformis]
MKSVTDELKELASRQPAEKKGFFPSVTKSLCHSDPKQILEQLVKEVKAVDFSQFTGSEDPRAVHHRIYTVKNMVHLAKVKGWGLCKRNGSVYVFTGSHWQAVDAEDMKAFLGEAALRSGVPRFRADDYKFRDELLKQFHSEAHLAQPTFSRDVTLINLQNGTFEITADTQGLREYRRADFMTHVLPFSYQEGAQAHLFQAFLDRVLPDIASQRVLAEFIGYVFVRGLKLEKALLLYGSGANGKSVFFDVLRALLGDQNASSYSLSSLTDSKYGYYRAMLANKLVNYTSEIHSKLEAHLFKQLVSGEPVEARLPYGNPFILTDYAKLIFNANELPRDVEHTHAFFRRFLIVPFTVTIPEAEQDKQLAEKIVSAELPGVFNWVLDGLRRLLEQGGFSKCKAAEDAVNQYRKESDSVAMFIDERGYKPSPDRHEPLGDLYKDYKNFCTDDGFRAFSKTNFSKRLQALGFEKRRMNYGPGFFLARTSVEPF